MSFDDSGDRNKMFDLVVAPLAEWASRLRTLAASWEAGVHEMDDPSFKVTPDLEPVVLRKLKWRLKGLWDCIRELDSAVERVRVIRDRDDEAIRAINGLSTISGESERRRPSDVSIESEPKCTHSVPDFIN